MKHLIPGLLLVLLVTLSLLGCRANAASEDEIIFADGTRGCKQSLAPVSLWDLPGGVPCGAEIVGEIPHSTRLIVLDRASRFGIDYYLVEYEGQRGWIPRSLTDEVEPLCQ